MVLGPARLPFRRDGHRRGDDHRRVDSAKARRPRPRVPRAVATERRGLAAVQRPVMAWHRDLVDRKLALSSGVAASEPLLRRAVANLGPDDAETLAIDLKHLADSVAALMKDAWAWSLVERQQSDAATLQRVRTAALAFLVRSNGDCRRARNLCREAGPIAARPSVPRRVRRNCAKLRRWQEPVRPLRFSLEVIPTRLRPDQVGGTSANDAWRLATHQQLPGFCR